MGRLVTDVIKSGAIIAFITTLFIFFGFISNFAQNRVIGIPVEEGDINTYVESGAIFIIQSIQALFNYPLSFKYLGINYYLVTMIVFMAMVLVVIKLRSNILSETLRNQVFLFVPFLMLIGYANLSVNIYKPFYEITSIIQPATLIESEGLYKAKNSGFKYNEKVINKYYNSKFNNCEDTNIILCLFDMRKSLDASIRKEVYITLIQVSVFSIVMLILFFHWIGGFRMKYLEMGFISLLFLQLISIPYIHGVIGANYTYPVVNVNLKKQKGVPNKAYNGVIVLREKNNLLYFLDRQNFMSIYQINRSSIDSVEQLATISLFVNCSQEVEKVSLCEEIFW